MANFPSIPLSDIVRGTQGLGLKQFVFQEHYAATGLRGHNSRRQVYTWIWRELTHEQIETLRRYFLDLEGGFVRWTPPGQTVELKWRPISDIDKAFAGYDNGEIQIQVGQDFRNA